MSDGHRGAALITGVTGQDGYYLSELLLAEDFRVAGVIRAGSDVDSVAAGVVLHYADLTAPESVAAVVDAVRPDLVFHLAAVSSVAASWVDPVLTTTVNALSTAAVLDACVRAQDRTGSAIVVVNASSCEIFAGSTQSPQTEDTPVQPISPYGAAKAFGHNLCRAYRAKGLEAVNLILYNHESPRRPHRFVTRKITSTVAAIAAGRADRLTLGDLSIRRDWGWAPDYVRAMYLAGCRGSADDFVIATGETHSIAEFAATAFAAAGLGDWERYLACDTELLRPADCTTMVGDASKAQALLGWSASRPFDAIVTAMVDADLRQEQHA